MKVNIQDILLQVFPLEGKIKTWSLREVVRDNNKVLAGSTAGACMHTESCAMHVCTYKAKRDRRKECSLGDSAREFHTTPQWLHSWFTIEIMLIWIVHFQLFIPKAALSLLSSISVLAATYKGQEQLQELERRAPAIFFFAPQSCSLSIPCHWKKSWVHLI